MHNVWVRLNAVIFFGLTALLLSAILCAFSTYFHNGIPRIKTLQMRNLRSLKHIGGNDRALFTFDINADLRPAFHWNLKQLFVFVVAEYTSAANVLNQVIIWDKIIKATDDAWIRESNVFVKYALIDQGQELRNKTVSLRLMWDSMPLTGRIYMTDERMKPFTLPASYRTS